MELKEMGILQLAEFFQGGCNNLAAHKESINALNVFPVPDGDTGINMYLTINSAVKNISDPAKNEDAGKMVQNFSMGALMGARGNSGVILSQIFRGFSQSIDGKKIIKAKDFAAALQKGTDLSYKSVMKPVEGTILTVFKDFSRAAMAYAQKHDDIIAMLEYALAAGEKSLANTPNLLPVLKQAGVIDAGGKGILTIMEGGLAALKGEALSVLPQPEAEIIQRPLTAAAAHDGEIEFIYCTEVMIFGDNPPEEEIQNLLINEIPGDSLVVVGMNEVVKIHYHTNTPWEILKIASRYGELRDIKIDNMKVQHNALGISAENPPPAPTPIENNKCGVLAVCVGDGISQIFNNLGAVVISGGQTMNPSAEEILNAINKLPAEEVIVLPNNSNIILTARQAEKLAQKPVKVLESKFITQGLGAMLAFDKDRALEENHPEMTEIMNEVISGELTFAVRDSCYGDKTIKAQDILALMDGEIVFNGQDLKASALKLIEAMVKKSADPSIISLFYGNDLKEEAVKELVSQIEEEYPDLDIEYRYGGQPLYYYLISVE